MAHTIINHPYRRRIRVAGRLMCGGYSGWYVGDTSGMIPIEVWVIPKSTIGMFIILPRHTLVDSICQIVNIHEWDTGTPQAVIDGARNQ